MAEEVDKKVFQRTRDTLGKIIKKPPLTDKLLSRPPFRFIHDILMHVSANSGFFKGLYAGSELDSKGNWDRDAKISFLNKAIDVLVFTTEAPVKVKASKIVSGQEVERTNEFLQLLGIAVLKKMDSSDAVKRVCRGERPSGPSVEKKKHAEGKKDSESKQATKSSKDTIEGEPSVPAAEVDPSLPDPPPLERPQHRPGTRRHNRTPARDVVVEDKPEVKGLQSTPSDEEASSTSATQLQERPTSAKQRRTNHPEPPVQSAPNENQDNSPVEMTKESTSPPPLTSGLISAPKQPTSSSSRPPPPRVVRRQVDLEDTSRASSGHNKPPPPVVILDQPNRDDDDEEEEEEYVVSDKPLGTVQATFNIEAGDDEAAEGALTKKLKERLIEGEEESSSYSTAATISEAQRRREREMVKKEVEKLQNGIQRLCQSANPLGKIMDYVQEDLDSMEQELTMWRKENAKYSESLRKEEKITEEELGPLRAQLSELDSRVRAQMDLINTVKANILRCDERLLQMIETVHLPH